MYREPIGDFSVGRWDRAGGIEGLEGEERKDDAAQESRRGFEGGRREEVWVDK